MASPQAAGAVALVMSAAHQQEPAIPIVGSILKKAIMNSADYLTEYTPLDQGRGVINIPKAFDYYKRYMKNAEDKKVLGYDISTISPIFKSEEGPTAYWRFGNALPDAKDKQQF